MKKILTLLLAVLGLNTACSQNFENMEVKEFTELIVDSNVVILDVRKADELPKGISRAPSLLTSSRATSWNRPRQNCRKKRLSPSIAVVVAALPMQPESWPMLATNA